jgi:hypothetical protein
LARSRARDCRIIWCKGVSTKIRLCPVVNLGAVRMWVPSMMCGGGSLTASWTKCRRRACHRAYRCGSVTLWSQGSSESIWPEVWIVIESMQRKLQLLRQRLCQR